MFEHRLSSDFRGSGTKLLTCLRLICYRTEGFCCKKASKVWLHSAWVNKQFLKLQALAGSSVLGASTKDCKIM